MKVFVAALAVILAACSSDEGSDSSGALQAPMLMDVVPMEGALHLTWMNMQADAESVEAERMMDTGAFEPAFSVPGSVDNRMDTVATDDMPYTYRLRAKKGTALSEYSNELTANPRDVP
jgi:hypothetical protein